MPFLALLAGVTAFADSAFFALVSLHAFLDDSAFLEAVCSVFTGSEDRKSVV